MNVVVMVDRSAGNNMVGDMWTNTYIFKGDTKLREVFEALHLNYGDNLTIHKNIRINIGQEME
jgi:hypothetical protein